MSLHDVVLNFFNPFPNLVTINRKHEISSIVFAIGGSINKDLSLNRALVEAATTAMSKHYKVKLRGASAALDAGSGIKEVLSSAELSFLPKEVRVILASNLSNISKGDLLCDWRKKDVNFLKLKRAMAPAVSALATGGLVFMSLILFVIPQFREIAVGSNTAMGSNIDIGILMKILIFLSSSFYVSSLLLLISMLSPVLTITILKKVFYAQKLTDYYNLYRYLSIIDINEFDKFLGLISNKILFPKNYDKFRKFASAIRSGANLEEAGELSRIDNFYIWFIKLGLNSTDPKSMFGIALKVMNSKINALRGALVAIIPAIITVLMGLGVGLIAVAVFQMLIKILVASIG